jgi:hypothetical protein
MKLDDDPTNQQMIAGDVSDLRDGGEYSLFFYFGAKRQNRRTTYFPDNIRKAGVNFKLPG